MSDKEKLMDLKVKFDALNDVYGDLPDGAYFAVLEENGITSDDLAMLEDANLL